MIFRPVWERTCPKIIIMHFLYFLGGAQCMVAAHSNLPKTGCFRTACRSFKVKLDAMGNVIAEKEADMDPKKRKKEIKAIEKQLKDNKKKGTLSQEEVRALLALQIIS